MTIIVNYIVFRINFGGIMQDVIGSRISEIKYEYEKVVRIQKNIEQNYERKKDLIYLIRLKKLNLNMILKKLSEMQQH